MAGPEAEIRVGQCIAAHKTFRSAATSTTSNSSRARRRNWCAPRACRHSSWLERGLRIDPHAIR